MIAAESYNLYAGFEKAFITYTGENESDNAFNSEGVDFYCESLPFEYSSMQGESIIPPELYMYAFPSCYGLAITPAINNKNNMEMLSQYPEKYRKLLEKKNIAKESVMEKYGLNNLTGVKAYKKTHGSKSKEMTDYYYTQFDQEGQSLIKLFYPAVAEKYNY